MNIYIPDIDLQNADKKSLFILTRPFSADSGWTNMSSERQIWNISENYSYTNDISKADVYFIPKPINTYSKAELKHIDLLCENHDIKGYGYISGDFGEDFGTYKHIFLFRMGGFKSQLSEKNKGFPVLLSDHFERIYKKEDIDIRKKDELPVVGFCGHANTNLSTQIREYLRAIKENVKRFLKSPIRKDYEPLFSSAYCRIKILKRFEISPFVMTNFIYRDHYRAGAQTDSERLKTTLEYYDNIKNSDYVVCVRGAGNFSVRLYETLMMGRIPVFVNTNCLLPFEDVINWNNHVVWVEWDDRKVISDIVSKFHANITGEQFKMMQLNNRKLWKETLSVRAMLTMLPK